MPQVTVNIPEEMKKGFKELTTEEVDALVSKALRERLPERLMFKEADVLLKDSKITGEMALSRGRESKKKTAKRRNK